MSDSQMTEEIDIPISSNLPSFCNNYNNNNENQIDSLNDNILHSAEAVIPYENYLAMQQSSTPISSEECIISTQYTPLSMELREEVKGSHRNGEIRKMALLCLKDGMTPREVAKQFKVSKQTIFNWKNQWKKKGKLIPYVSTGRPKILWDEPIKRILSALKANPSATNEMLCAVADNMIAPRTISDYLKRENITQKRIVDGGAQKMDDRIIQETRDFYLSIIQIPWKNRVYMDESFVYNNEACSMGRSKKGEPINRVRDKRGKRWTMYLAIRVDGLVHPPILKPLNADDKEFMKYVEQSLIPCLRPGEIVIWDRLGRSGRCKAPNKQHYNPRARQLIEEKGCHLMILPPKGKYFDPIELVFGLLKGEVRKTYGASVAAAEQRPRTEVEIREAVANASLKITSEHIFGFFKERSNGKSFRTVYPHLVDRIFS
jgi:transposase